jgi:hypothetical protein
MRGGKIEIPSRQARYAIFSAAAKWIARTLAAAVDDRAGTVKGEIRYSSKLMQRKSNLLYQR